MDAVSHDHAETQNIVPLIKKKNTPLFLHNRMTQDGMNNNIFAICGRSVIWTLPS